VWSVRYNPFHDQLILTCSSDNRVVLSSIPSLSSEPFKTIIDDDNHTNEMANNQEQKIEPDRVVKVYEEHEDSVYVAE
jgi:hypothetical protein